jgi:hypothetical protein
MNFVVSRFKLEMTGIWTRPELCLLLGWGTSRLKDNERSLISHLLSISSAAWLLMTRGITWFDMDGPQRNQVEAATAAADADDSFEARTMTQIAALKADVRELIAGQGNLLQQQQSICEKLERCSEQCDLTVRLLQQQLQQRNDAL